MKPTPAKQLTIARAASFNHHSNFKPANAHDGDFETLYSVKDGAVAGNFLKLYLSKADKIGEVKMTSRKGFDKRMVNTEVKLYSTESEDEETEVWNCGKITGKS